MAILMLYDRDNTHPDPAKDARGCWKRGYIVQVFSDDQKLVIPPAEPFLFIKVTGAPVDDYESWGTEPEYDETAKVDEMGALPVTRRRAYMLDLDVLPQEAQEALKSKRYWEM